NHFCKLFILFFQAEDGIRDRNVTGVQTCALPISIPSASGSSVLVYNNSFSAAEAWPVWEECASSAITANRRPATRKSLSSSSCGARTFCNAYGNVCSVNPIIGVSAANASNTCWVLEPSDPEVIG